MSMPGGYIPTLETKQRECWKFETRDVNSEFESRVSVQPSNIPFAWFPTAAYLPRFPLSFLFILSIASGRPTVLLSSPISGRLTCSSLSSLSRPLSSFASLRPSGYLGISCLFKIKGAYISRAAFPEPCVALLSSGRLRKYRAHNRAKDGKEPIKNRHNIPTLPPTNPVGEKQLRILWPFFCMPNRPPVRYIFLFFGCLGG